MKLRNFLYILLAVISLGAVPAIAQMWGNFPILGGASYCFQTGNAGTCTSTIPAGPAMTGLETIPTDTNAANGGNPQTVKTPITALGAGTLNYSVPTTGGTVTATAQNRNVIIEPAGTLSTLTLVLPAATTLTQGQKLGFCTTQIVSTLTVTAGTGTTVSTAPTAMLVPVVTGGASCVEWVYRQANTTWYRTQ